MSYILKAHLSFFSGFPLAENERSLSRSFLSDEVQSPVILMAIKNSLEEAEERCESRGALAQSLLEINLAGVICIESTEYMSTKGFSLAIGKKLSIDLNELLLR